jgi:hypothetical protein
VKDSCYIDKQITYCIKSIPLILFYISILAYITEEGKTKVNMFFKAPDNIQLTKIRIKVKEVILILKICIIPI